MEQSIKMLDEALAISHKEVEAIEDKNVYLAEELLKEREKITRQLNDVAIFDKILFFEKLQELQRMQVLIIEKSQKLRREYVGMLQRSDKEKIRMSAYKKVIGQALASAY